MKTEGPLGIRTAVWLFVFGSVLVCILIFSRHHAEEPTRQLAAEVVREQDSSPHMWHRDRKTTRRDVSPEKDEDSVGFSYKEIDLSMAEQLIQDRRTWTDGDGDAA
jgi:hypothetical protein